MNTDPSNHHKNRRKRGDAEAQRFFLDPEGAGPAPATAKKTSRRQSSFRSRTVPADPLDSFSAIGPSVEGISKRTAKEIVVRASSPHIYVPHPDVQAGSLHHNERWIFGGFMGESSCPRVHAPDGMTRVRMDGTSRPSVHVDRTCRLRRCWELGRSLRDDVSGPTIVRGGTHGHDRSENRDADERNTFRKSMLHRGRRFSAGTASHRGRGWGWRWKWRWETIHWRNGGAHAFTARVLARS